MKRQEVRKTIGFVALLLFQATIFYMSPYLSVIGPALGIITGSLIYFFILFASALFLRRAHCGWTCISTGVHDAGLFFITKKVGMRSRIIKYFIWAPFIVIGDKLGRLLKIPSLHLEANKEKCNGCGLCSIKCPMSLPVKEMALSGETKNTDCILCGECVDNCARKAICYKFS